MQDIFQLLAASDVHGNRERMDRIIKYLNEEDVDAGVFLGDMTEYKSFYEADRDFYPESLKAPSIKFAGHGTTHNGED